MYLHFYCYCIKRLVMIFNKILLKASLCTLVYIQLYFKSVLVPFAICKIILNKFGWMILQGLSTLFELSDAYRLSDSLLL